MEEDYKYYPPKPQPSQTQNDWMKSLISMGLFVLMFSFLLGFNFQMVLIVLIVLLIHEVGHMTAMKLTGHQEQSMLFLPLVTNFSNEGSDSSIKRAITLLSGPIPGLIIGSGIAYYASSIEHDSLRNAGFIFCLLNLFNLLPYDPLDGGKLLDTLFGKDAEIVKIVFLAIGILLFLAGIAVAPIISAIMCAFMGIRIMNIIKMRQLRQKLYSEQEISLNKSFEDLSDEEYWEIRRAYLKGMRKSPIDPDKFEPFLNEDLLINQVKLVLESKKGAAMSVFSKVVVLVFWILSLALPLWLMVYTVKDIIE